MRVTFVLILFLLASCGGRVAHPVAPEKSFDSQMSCDHLAGEYENNIKRLEELTGESRDKFADNVGFLIVGPLFLDFSKTQKREAEAIIARDERLTALMAKKACSETPAPDQQIAAGS